MDVLTEPLAQLGAVGVMITVFAFVLRYALKEVSSERDARLKRGEFIENLVEKAQEREDAHLEAWKGMTGEFIAGQRELTGSIKEFTSEHQELVEVVVNGTDEVKKQMRADHSGLDARFFQVERALTKLETTVSVQPDEIVGRLRG